MATVRMSGAEFSALLSITGLSARELAQTLNVNERTVRAWRFGRDAVPPRIAKEMRGLVEQHTIQVGLALATASETGFVVIPGHPREGDRPRSWYLAVVGRAMIQMPELRAVWDDPKMNGGVLSEGHYMP